MVDVSVVDVVACAVVVGCLMEWFVMLVQLLLMEC